MVRMKKLSVLMVTAIITGFLLLLTGCTNESQQTEQQITEWPEELQVSLKTDHNQVKVNDPVKITANVEYGDIDISEDTKVDFEIIENGVPIGTLPSEYEGNQKYSVVTKFSSTGQHQVVVHVYYEWFHEMRKLKFKVSE